MARKDFFIDAGVAIALVGGNLLIAARYLLTDFSSEAWNNDYTYIAMARMFRDQPWTWNALQYGGAPFAYVYPPLFQILMAATPGSLGHAYHLLSGLGYALVPVSLYVLALRLFSSRFAALFAALAYSFLASPVYLLFPVWRNLASSFHYAPWGFVAMIGYSEAGHTVALAVTLLAIAAAWQNRWKAASFYAAAVFLLNWPGMIGLCTAFAALAVARAREVGFGRAAVRSLAAVSIGYGIGAFWMTPGFFYATTLLNRMVLRHEATAAPWNARTWAILMCGAALVGAALWRRTPPVASFLASWLAILGTIVATFSLAGNYLVPLPHRYVMEFNVALVLAVASLACLGRKRRITAVAASLIFGGWAAHGFLRDPWTLQPSNAEPGKMLAFQISDWLMRNAGSSRVFTAGELDGSLNALTDVAQVGGTRQGVSNLLIFAAQRQVSLGCAEHGRTARVDELWLRALDAQFAVVHDAGSREHFHWFVDPQAFAGFPVAWTNGAGDTIYRLPPQEQAVVVDLATFEHLPPLRSTDDIDFLETYVSWAQGKRPAHIEWTRPDTAHIEAEVGPGDAVLVKVNYDRGWSSGAGSVQPDPIGFVLIRAPSGHQRFDLHFGAAWDVWLARFITLLTVALLLVRAPAGIIAALAAGPALAAYVFLLASPPAQVMVAEDAFRKIQPPLINPGGVVDSVGPPGSAPLITIYGSNFGTAQDRVVVWIGGREGDILYRGPNQLNVQIPPQTPPGAAVTVEVNGCRGNSFTLKPG